MTEQQHCIYPDREAAIVAYLYDEIDGFQRVAFETHVTTCELCRSELADLRGVRSTLAQWVAPETVRSHQSAATQPSRWWQAVPVWAQVAAAILVLGVSASIANLDVRYDRANGLSVKTGWTKPASAPQAQVADATPWRAELAAMQKQLRDEMRAKPPAITPASAAPVVSDEELNRRVAALIDESERKQQKGLALQLVQLQQDFNVQRQSDLGQVYRALGLFQDTTRGELLSQRQALRMAVSQTK